MKKIINKVIEKRENDKTFLYSVSNEFEVLESALMRFHKIIQVFVDLHNRKYQCLIRVTEDMDKIYDHSWPHRLQFFNLITTCRMRMEKFSTDLERLCLEPIKERMKQFEEMKKQLNKKIESFEKKKCFTLVNDSKKEQLKINIDQQINLFKSSLKITDNDPILSSIMLILCYESKSYHWDMNENFSSLYELTDKMNFAKISGLLCPIVKNDLPMCKSNDIETNHENNLSRSISLDSNEKLTNNYLKDVNNLYSSKSTSFEGEEEEQFVTEQSKIDYDQSKFLDEYKSRITMQFSNDLILMDSPKKTLDKKNSSKRNNVYKRIHPAVPNVIPKTQSNLVFKENSCSEYPVLPLRNDSLKPLIPQRNVSLFITMSEEY